MMKDTLHLKAPGNWINDPNGFIYYEGKYHLFYQHFPYAPEWGTMHWGHAVSEDLVHWEHLGIALFPSKRYDQNGVFSGSAMEKDGKLYFYYSAVRYLETDEEDIHHAKDEKFVTSQAMIVSEDGYTFDNFGGKKQIIPVIQDEKIAHPANTRDPKVWKYQDTWYMILGSTVSGETGRVLFFKSRDAQNWEYVSQYRNEKFGTMLECPDLFAVNGHYVFAGSPMNIMKDGKEYPHQSVCALVSFEEGSCRMEMPEKDQFIDYGLDLYAPQTNLDKDGNRVMIAWMRMPEAVKGDGERADWNGMMGIPRVVDVQNDHIYFRVHPEADRYLSRKVESRERIDYTKPYRLKVTLREGEVLDIGGYTIRIEEDCIKTDRSRVFVEDGNYRLTAVSPELDGNYKLDIFVDPNLIEIFINDGQYVISQVVYGLEAHITGRVEEILAE